MRLIDTHTHLYCEEFDHDRQQVIQRALQAGVVHMLLPAIDPETYQRQQQLAASNTTLFSQMMGLHPTSVGDDYEQILIQVQQQLDQHPDRYIAVGEIGLDLYWDTSRQDQQVDALKRQMQLAVRHNLPVALHVRNAYDELFQVLRDINNPTYNGVFHCYSGTLHQAQQAIEMGWHLGIGGTLTYKKSTLPDIIKQMPLERILLETDSPYLPPTPHRGKRNESSYVSLVATFLAQILDKSDNYIGELTTTNSIRLFNLWQK